MKQEVWFIFFSRRMRGREKDGVGERAEGKGAR